MSEETKTSIAYDEFREACAVMHSHLLQFRRSAFNFDTMDAENEVFELELALKHMKLKYSYFKIHCAKS